MGRERTRIKADFQPHKGVAKWLILRNEIQKEKHILKKRWGEKGNDKVHVKHVKCKVSVEHLN